MITTTHRRSAILPSAVTATLLLSALTACATSGADSARPSASVAQEVCGLAQQADESAAAGDTQQMMDLTTEMLDTAQELPPDNVLHYRIIYLEDGYVDSVPSESVPPLLEDLVHACAEPY